MHQWEDGTVGHFFRYEKSGGPPLRAGMERAGAILIVPFSFRSNYVPMLCLCETEEERKRGYGIPGMPLVKPPSPANVSAGFPHVVCPSGHYTHQFLACDVQSACQPRDGPAPRDGEVTPLCKSILATLFTCRNGVDFVPYSMVCDHNQDCLDASDEDFCVYPSCSGGWLFECANKQVSQGKERASRGIISRATLWRLLGERGGVR